MLNYAPPVGSCVLCDDGGIRKRHVYRGRVIEHVSDDDWGDGFRVEWPTMKYRKAKGCTVYHSLPNPWIQTEGPSC